MAVGAVGNAGMNKAQTFMGMSQKMKGGFLAGMNAVQVQMHESIVSARQENAEDNIPYSIGADSYTEAEWDNFLERFDATQDVIRQLMRKKHQRLKEKQEECEEMRERELEKQLLEDELKEKEIHPVAQVESRIQHTLDHQVDIRYTTLFVKEGEQIRKAGKIKKYEWPQGGCI